MKVCCMDFIFSCSWITMASLFCHPLYNFHVASICKDEQVTEEIIINVLLLEFSN